MSHSARLKTGTSESKVLSFIVAAAHWFTRKRCLHTCGLSVMKNPMNRVVPGFRARRNLRNGGQHRLHRHPSRRLRVGCSGHADCRIASRVQPLPRRKSARDVRNSIRNSLLVLALPAGWTITLPPHGRWSDKVRALEQEAGDYDGNME